MTTTGNPRLAERMETALRDSSAPAPGTLAVLHRRLETRAGEEGALDVAYTTVDTPVGPLLLAATGEGLVRVAYEREGFDAVLETLADRLSPRILRAPGRLEETARQLDEYFAGTRTAFDLPLDRSLSAGFRLVVQRHLPDIAYGRTESYRDVARLVGSPQAVRAVGTACATNPLPVVVPCHRVVASSGKLGGYAGGPPIKQQLIDLESGHSEGA